MADGHTKRVCHLRAGRRDGKYLRLSRSGQPVIDQARVREHARLDGKLVVHSNDDAPNAEDTALGYKQLQRVEEAWRTLQSGLRLRPVYHYAPPLRIHAPVFLTVLAQLLERIAEQACGDTWRTSRIELKGIKLARLLSPNGTVCKVTDPSPETASRLKS
ncbi:MAG: transposase [Gammaproteobacteria bacterium]|nr:transposase [Gammaproteobacteria bacterium]